MLKLRVVWWLFLFPVYYPVKFCWINVFVKLIFIICNTQTIYNCTHGRTVIKLYNWSWLCVNRKKPEFMDAMRRMEKDPLCQGFPMITFLLLPMQRITRLPLLVDAICHRMELATDQHKSATRALDALNKVLCWHGYCMLLAQIMQSCHLVRVSFSWCRELRTRTLLYYVVDCWFPPWR